MARGLFAAALLLGACSQQAGPVIHAPAAPAGSESPRSPPDVRLPPSEAVREPSRTAFLPHPAAPFHPVWENAIWCAAFPMAWDALGREVLKGPPLLGPPAPAAFVEGMNAHPFPREALDPASCIAMAGTKAGGILERIREEGLRKFGKEIPKRAIDLPGPRSILAYAFLRKDLPFEHPFETFDDGMPFAGSAEPVRAFGLTQEGEDLRRDDIASQVNLLFDRGEGEDREFGIRIETRGGKDELLLARVRPGETLEATWKAAAARCAEKPEPFPSGSVLGIPKVHFDLDHDFVELEGAPMRNGGFEEYSVHEAYESILFRMDETGLRLEAEAAVPDLEDEVEPPRAFLFDRPFLIALREKDAREPYLLAWIANTDLMPK